MRSSEIENACMVVRTPVARAAHGDRSHTRYRGSAARGPGVLEQRLLLTGRFFRGVQGPSRPRKNLPEARRARMSTCEARSGTAARVDLSVIICIVKIRCVRIRRARVAPRGYGTQTYGTQIPEVRARAAARGPARSIQPGHIEFGTGDWSLSVCFDGNRFWHRGCGSK